MPNECSNFVDIYADQATLDIIRTLFMDTSGGTPDTSRGDSGDIVFDQHRHSPLGSVWDFTLYAESQPFDNTGEVNPSQSLAPHETRELTLFFITKWTPARDGLRELSTMFPTARIELAYDEPGMDIGGEITFIDGEEVAVSERMAARDCESCYNENREWVQPDPDNHLFYCLECFLTTHAADFPHTATFHVTSSHTDDVTDLAEALTTHTLEQFSGIATADVYVAALNRLAATQSAQVIDGSVLTERWDTFTLTPSVVPTATCTTPSDSSVTVNVDTFIGDDGMWVWQQFLQTHPDVTVTPTSD